MQRRDRARAAIVLGGVGRVEELVEVWWWSWMWREMFMGNDFQGRRRQPQARSSRRQGYLTTRQNLVT
jgi:hypothetical protein